MRRATSACRATTSSRRAPIEVLAERRRRTSQRNGVCCGWWDRSSSGLPVLWRHVSRVAFDHRREYVRSLVLVELVLVTIHVVQYRQVLVLRQRDDSAHQRFQARLATVAASRRRRAQLRL